MARMVPHGPSFMRTSMKLGAWRIQAYRGVNSQFSLNLFSTGSAKKAGWRHVLCQSDSGAARHAQEEAGRRESHPEKVTSREKENAD
jgi:hypothetical protein